MKYIPLALAAALIFVSPACSLTAPDQDDDTFPGALDLPSISLEALKQTRPAPDSVNVLGYVVGDVRCPEDAACFLPDGILIAKSPDQSQEEALFIPSGVPPYKKRVQYVFSVAFSQRTFSDGEVKRDFRLLGLSRKK